MRVAYLVMAAMAGGITALSVQPYDGMSRKQIVLTVFTSAMTAIFIGPLIVTAILGAHADLRLQAGIFYIVATGNNAFVAAGIKWTMKFSPFGKGGEQ